MQIPSREALPGAARARPSLPDATGPAGMARPFGVARGHAAHAAAAPHEGHRTQAAGGAARLERAIEQVLQSWRATAAPAQDALTPTGSPVPTASIGVTATAADTATSTPMPAVLEVDATPMADADGVEGLPASPAATEVADATEAPEAGSAPAGRPAAALQRDLVDALYAALREVGGGRHGPRHSDGGAQAPRGHAFGHHDDHGWRGRGIGSLTMRLESLVSALQQRASASAPPPVDPTTTPASTGSAPTAPSPAMVGAVEGAAAPAAETGPTAPTTEAAPAPEVDRTPADPLDRLRLAFDAFAAATGAAPAAPGTPGSSDALVAFLSSLALALRPGPDGADSGSSTGQLIDLRA